MCRIWRMWRLLTIYRSILLKEVIISTRAAIPNPRELFQKHFPRAGHYAQHPSVLFHVYPPLSLVVIPLFPQWFTNTEPFLSSSNTVSQSPRSQAWVQLQQVVTKYQIVLILIHVKGSCFTSKKPMSGANMGVMTLIKHFPLISMSPAIILLTGARVTAGNIGVVSSMNFFPKAGLLAPVGVRHWQVIP